MDDVIAISHRVGPSGVSDQIGLGELEGLSSPGNVRDGRAQYGLLFARAQRAAHAESLFQELYDRVRRDEAAGARNEHEGFGA